MYAYDEYLEHAFPKVRMHAGCATTGDPLTWLGRQQRNVAFAMQDDLRPISCTGHNSQGGMALTLVDALDSLVVSALLKAGSLHIWIATLSWIQRSLHAQRN